MTKTELEQFKEQHKLFLERQRVMQARFDEQLKYPYGPWREVLFYPLALAIGLICIGALLGYGLTKLVPMLP
jgi:hypothetical protein